MTAAAPGAHGQPDRSNATNAPEKVVRIKGTVEAGPETPASPVKEQSPMAPVEKTN